MNHLHFPPTTKQTRHTHPSARVGIVARGRGTCIAVEGPKVRRVPLEPGVAFLIPEEVEHAFETQDALLDVIAFHPDSDFGPTPVNHPMINRTVVGGVSASLLPDVQTKFGRD